MKLDMYYLWKRDMTCGKIGPQSSNRLWYLHVETRQPPLDNETECGNT